jgi:hypothetical protein
METNSSDSAHGKIREVPPTTPRRRWEPPTIEKLPPLTDLTLFTGDPIGGGGDTGSGTTVF